MQGLRRVYADSSATDSIQLPYPVIDCDLSPTGWEYFVGAQRVPAGSETPMVWESLDSEVVSIAMRPYIILEDENGDTVTIYGGIVYRSIGYIAYQNRKAFTPGSAAYEYVWNIIHYVYGKQYDADYKK